MPNGAATAHLILPKIVTTLREGYGAADFRRDAAAALTVAIVALPLSMAIAVASGVSPQRGLYTAIIGGFVVSALSGSRFQIGGPAGAFIVLVAATVARFGLDGLLLTVFVSGVLLAICGFLLLGGLIRRIPASVTLGFTLGIATTIFVSQIKDLTGLSVKSGLPSEILPKIFALSQAWRSVNLSALGLGMAVVLIVLAVRRVRPAWPSLLIAVVAATACATLFGLPVETIGARFGQIPSGLPMPRIPAISVGRLFAILPTALSFTLLGGVESLLSAKVADGMTGREHRPNMELVGQGFANIASAFFGGISVTGTIARTATNIRAGAVSPIAGMLHALFVLVFLVVAAPLASFTPLAVLSGVLVLVCANMAELSEVRRVLGIWREAVPFGVTYLGTLVFDLTTGVVAGCVIALMLAFLPAKHEEPAS